MKTELILDEEGLLAVLKFYLQSMRNGCVQQSDIRPINPALITRIEIHPRIKRVKVIYELGNGQPKSDALR